MLYKYNTLHSGGNNFMKYSKIYNIDEIKTISHSIFSNIDCIKNVYLFGSYARRKATEHSDLDFLVELSCYDVPSKREVYGHRTKK